MINLKFFLVTYNELRQDVTRDLSNEEKESLVCYAVQQNVFKFISPGIPVIKEWELDWFEQRYQTLQYYEYGTMVHCFKNPELIENISHVGLLHYDVRFQKNSINEIKEKLEINPNKIFYVTARKSNQLFFTFEQFKHISNFLNLRLEINIDPEKVWNNVWISEALSVTPVDVYKKFGVFIL
jgi:hypothetical protein